MHTSKQKIMNSNFTEFKKLRVLRSSTEIWRDACERFKGFCLRSVRKLRKKNVLKGKENKILGELHICKDAKNVFV